MGFVDAPDPRAVMVNEIERLEVTEEETNHGSRDMSIPAVKTSKALNKLRVIADIDHFNEVVVSLRDP